MSAYVKYMDECSVEKDNRYFGNKYKELWNSICSAFEKHPSDAEINFSILSKSSELFGARGYFETKYGNVLDTEPARSDSFAPLQNIVKRILHPDNNRILSEILGEKDTKVTNEWWNKYIKPLWTNIKELYTEPTTWSLEEIRTYKDAQWNKFFRTQSPKILKKPSNMIVQEFSEPVVGAANEKTIKKKNFIQRFLGLCSNIRRFGVH